MYKSQMIRPKITDPVIGAPLIIGNPRPATVATARTAAASSTGPAATTPRKTLRRDHSIWPSDKSKTRNVAVISRVVAGVVVMF